MAKSKHKSLQYAIKFYLSQAAFQAEVALYGSSGSARSSTIAKFLPLVRPFRQLNLQCLKVGDTVGPPIVLEQRNGSAPNYIQRQQPQKTCAQKLQRGLAATTSMVLWHSLDVRHDSPTRTQACLICTMLQFAAAPYTE